MKTHCINCGKEKTVSPIDVEQGRITGYCRACNARLHKTVKQQDRTAYNKINQLAAKRKENLLCAKE